MSATSLNLILAGQVDHGKSTLIGRLLFDTGSLPDAAIHRLEEAAKKRGAEMEWAFALDSLQVERTQGITLDTTRIWLKRPTRDIVIIDAPGHHELLRNMLTGATNAEAALLLIDAAEGITPQTEKHAQILKLLGISQCVIVINKMDVVGFSKDKFAEISRQCEKTFSLSVKHIIPISAKHGDNITTASTNTPWYKGDTLLTVLDKLTPHQHMENAPFRMSVQDVVRMDGERIITGKIASGRVSVGDKLFFSPGSSITKLKAFKSWPEVADKKTASAGESVGLLLDTPVFSERGNVISHDVEPPKWLSHISATLVWLDKSPLHAGQNMTMRIGSQEMQADVQKIAQGRLTQHDIGEVTLKLRGMAVVDSAAICPEISRFALVNSQGKVVAAGFIDAAGSLDERLALSAHKSDHIRPFNQPINTNMFEARNQHKGGIFWFSGLSGAGKSTLAIEMQKMLFAKGKQVIILDGDNLRGGLCRDLGFAANEREENLRRASEVAKLFADSGMIVLTAFITPTEADRERARSIAPGKLHHIYIRADLELCEARDIKGLYKLARAGKIAEFTGISAPFETPVEPDLVVDTSQPLADCIDQLLHYIELHTALEPGKSK